ncbi:hypothetical protein N665_0030s0068 [Sinapis alba]|nr:hypothetical protein N665_0030s0068 [Sinapis alba]
MNLKRSPSFFMKLSSFEDIKERSRSFTQLQKIPIISMGKQSKDDVNFHHKTKQQEPVRVAKHIEEYLRKKERIKHQTSIRFYIFPQIRMLKEAFQGHWTVKENPCVRFP